LIFCVVDHYLKAWCSPFNANKKSGMAVFQISLGTEISKYFLFKTDLWYLKDTSSSLVDFNKTSEIASQNAFKSVAELNAQKRFGKTIGYEMNITFKYIPNRLLSFSIIGALFYPGKFFEEPIEEVVSKNGIPKGGPLDANFLGLAFGSELRF